MKHFFERVEGWMDEGQRSLYRQAVHAAPADRQSVFVEIGSFKGRSACFMGVEIVNSGKPITLYCVDHWEPDGDATTPFFRHASGAAIEFSKNTAVFGATVVPIRAKSWDAAAHFEDGAVDFLFVDACHEYPEVMRDLVAWRPKLRGGALLAGDDYSWPGVWRAVQETVDSPRRIGNCWHAA